MAIEANLAQVRDEVAEACHRAGRPESDVSLMAVSKMHPVEALLEAYAAGQRLFGENRVQEFAEKFPSLSALKDGEYHLIGPLQSNKSNRAVYIEVKLSHEESKHGIAPEELPALLNAISELEYIVPVGLMTVPPWSEDAETARPYFQTLRRLRDEQQRLHATLTQLSIGMSNDFAVAIAEGSTCVRIGTAIFGKRIVVP